ncbi:MAG: hypothetical protein ACP5IC_02180 [Minisyncoccia bacterium]
MINKIFNIIFVSTILIICLILQNLSVFYFDQINIYIILLFWLFYLLFFKITLSDLFGILLIFSLVSYILEPFFIYHILILAIIFIISYFVVQKNPFDIFFGLIYALVIGIFLINLLNFNLIIFIFELLLNIFFGSLIYLFYIYETGKNKYRKHTSRL